MARQKTKTHDATDVANDPNDIFGEQIAAQTGPRATLQEAMASTQHDGATAEQAATVTAMPADTAPPSSHLANPTSVRREGHAASVGRRQQGLPDKLSIPAGDMKVQLIDKGDNAAGIGIRIMFPEGSKDRPTSEEKEIIRRYIKGEDGERTGFRWDGQMWHKSILREGERLEDIPLTRPVAIRLDAERRVEKLAVALKHHQADPAGYADRVRQERDQRAQGDRIPD